MSENGGNEEKAKKLATSSGILLRNCKYAEAVSSIKEALQLNPNVEFGFEILVACETLFYGRETKEWERRKKYGNPFAYSGVDWYAILHLNSTATESRVIATCDYLLSCLSLITYTEIKKHTQEFYLRMAGVAKSLVEEAKLVLCDENKRSLFDHTRRDIWALVDSSVNADNVEDVRQAYLSWKPPVLVKDNVCNGRPIKKARNDVADAVSSSEEQSSAIDERYTASWVSGGDGVGEEVAVESVEDLKKRVFEAMPQTPHYQPLEKYDGIVRNGMVYGLEMAYVNLSEEIRGLVDPQSLWLGLNGFKKQLTQLEVMGFDVTLLKERLDKLQDIAKSEGPSLIAIQEFEADIANEEAKLKCIRASISEFEVDIVKSKVVINNKRCKIDELTSDSVKVLEEFQALARSAW